MQWIVTTKGSYKLAKDGVEALGWKERGKYWAMVYTFDEDKKFKHIKNFPPTQTLSQMKRMIEGSKWFYVPQVATVSNIRKDYVPTYKSNANPANMWWADERY